MYKIVSQPLDRLYIPLKLVINYWLYSLCCTIYHCSLFILYSSTTKQVQEKNRNMSSSQRSQKTLPSCFLYRKLLKGLLCILYNSKQIKNKEEMKFDTRVLRAISKMIALHQAQKVTHVDWRGRKSSRWYFLKMMKNNKLLLYTL